MTYQTEAEVEQAVRKAFSSVVEVLTAARSASNLYPAGLPVKLERALTFSSSTAAMLTLPPPATPEEFVTQRCAQVDAERDRRIDGGFTFSGHTFQSRPSDRENVMGAAQLAMGAISQGVQPGNLRWAAPDQDFVWITADNQLVPLDAFAVVALFQAGVAFKSAMTFHARALKDALLEASDPNAVDIETGWPE